jgi:catechol 2,3-dioxygenase-like lactoylglutathione lyase family enzyme
MQGFDKLVAFVGVRHAARAKAFYQGVPGLQLMREDEHALVFDVGGTMLRASLVPDLVPARFTVLGWQVDDIRGAMDALVRRGVPFERYSFLEQNELGVWMAPDGDQVAWFKDPDGNVLSLSQHAA